MRQMFSIKHRLDQRNYCTLQEEKTLITIAQRQINTALYISFVNVIVITNSISFMENNEFVITIDVTCHQ